METTIGTRHLEIYWCQKETNGSFFSFVNCPFIALEKVCFSLVNKIKCEQHIYRLSKATDLSVTKETGRAC